MSAVVKVAGLASVYMINSYDATIADVRAWLDEVQKLGLPDNTRLESANLKVSIRSEHLEMTECGDHLVTDQHPGIIMWSGPCKKDEEMTPEE